MFDDEDASGPVPTLFADNAETAAAAIALDLAKIHKDIMRLSKTLILPETITIREAIPIVKKPREGTGVILFKKPVFVVKPTSSKRPRQEDTSDTGTNSKIYNNTFEL